MGDTFAYCGCQYEPDEEFQKEHWHEIENPDLTSFLHCDVCDCDINYETKEYGVEP